LLSIPMGPSLLAEKDKQKKQPCMMHSYNVLS
jgi:hypothetical protein